MSWRRECATAGATNAAGDAFSRVLRPGDVVLLVGQLGAGKTTFVQGVAVGLGVDERVTSATFTMVRQHECHNDLGITTLHHADVYRVATLDEVRDLDLGELVEESGVALVEWGDLAASIYGRDVLTVEFTLTELDSRTLVVAGALSETRRDELDAWAAS